MAHTCARTDSCIERRRIALILHLNDSNVEVDGGNINNEPGGGRNNVIFPVIDSIAEFSIATSTYGADVGKRPGASGR